jgi:hypothetical protein
MRYFSELWKPLDLIWCVTNSFGKYFTNSDQSQSIRRRFFGKIVPLNVSRPVLAECTADAICITPSIPCLYGRTLNSGAITAAAVLQISNTIACLSDNQNIRCILAWMATTSGDGWPGHIRRFHADWSARLSFLWSDLNRIPCSFYRVNLFPKQIFFVDKKVIILIALAAGFHVND